MSLNAQQKEQTLLYRPYGTNTAEQSSLGADSKVMEQSVLSMERFWTRGHAAACPASASSGVRQGNIRIHSLKSWQFCNSTGVEDT
ncbi:MAG: hypothetical protein CSA33_06655 [Desulfobulbus propionicus]|nr:MAG: hypothetical protein CSA33_06655 [Desulfobulbus propionicus]